MPAQFQFTPLREGRLLQRPARCLLHDFNSRPSARGDVFAISSGVGWRISIHAPPRGATSGVFMRPLPPLHFNSRPSARGDMFSSPLSHNTEISIHAPPRGATYFSDVGAETLTFQFTPLREGRPASISRTTHSATFQFTPLREGRLGLGDLIVEKVDISIHAPPRGATQNSAAALAEVHYFNSRPSARGDLLYLRGKAS